MRKQISDFGRKFQILLSILFQLILGVVGSGQNNSLQFEHITGKAGLPQNSIYAICQDKEGFLWFGTADGLCRYDGTGMKIFRYDPADTNSLPGNFIRRLLVDTKGNIWIGTENGLCMYSPYKEKFRRVLLQENKYYTDVAFPYCELSTGEIFLGTTCNRFYKINPESFQMSEYPFSELAGKAFHNTSLYTIFNRDSSLIFSKSNSICIYNPEDKDLKTWPVKDTDFRNANDAVSKGDSLYLATYNGIIIMNILNGGYRVVKDIKVNNSSIKLGVVNTLIFSADGDILVGTNENGVLDANPYLQRGELYVNSPDDINSISFNSIKSLFFDNSGNLWLGTDGKGLNKSSVSNRFNKYNIQKRGKEFIPNDFIRCFYEDIEGNLFVGTYGAGLAIINPQRTASEIFKNNVSDPLSLQSNNLLCFLNDSKNNFWIGTDKGISRFDRKKKQFEKIQGEDVLVNSMIEVSPGKILAATNTMPFYFLDSNCTVKELADSNLLHVINFSKDKAGSIFVALNRKYFGYEKSKFKHEKNETGNFYFFCEADNCYPANDGTVWIASKTGLEHWNINGTLLNEYTDKDGLPDNYLYAILPDGKGNLWISSNNGISKFNIYNSVFKNYDVSDGLQSSEFNSNAAFTSKNGEMFFGGIDGFNSFFPDSIKDNTVVPATVILSCKIFNKEWKGDSSITCLHSLTLPYFENTITLTIASLEFTQPDQNLIAYRLLGLDTVWASLGTERIISFMGLSPGNYTLEVKSCNNDGVWNNTPERLSIHVIPPVWKTTWFLSLCVILLIIIIVFVVRYFARRKLKAQIEEIKLRHMLEKERTRISQDMHDEIGSGLSKISILSELAGNRNMLPDEREVQMNKITSTSRLLVDNIQEIIWSLNPRNDTLVGLLSYMHEYANEFFDSTSIELNFEYPVLSSNEGTYIKNTARRNIFLAYKETLNNIIKHSGADKVNITFSFNDHILQIVIKDNGKGIVEGDYNKNRNGLQNMTLRMKDCDGKVEITSAKNKGTTVHFIIKMEKELKSTTKM